MLNPGDRGSPLRAPAESLLPLLAVLTVLATVAGIVVRFKGLGLWPLAWDEYYLAQSIRNVLHYGLPQYPCGGYYSRGLLVQYLAALLQIAGLSGELAPRVIAAVCSLLALPAAFLIARRCAGLNAALVCVILLALSVWEVEMGRFGRMYAPFQAVFLWYVVCFLDYTVERRDRAFILMLILSVGGVLIWEGGALLALANFLPPLIRHADGRLSRADVGRFLVAAAIFVPVYWFATADLRLLGSAPTLPPGYQDTDAPGTSVLDGSLPPWRLLPAHPLWLLGSLLPLAAGALAVRQALQLKDRPLALVAVVGALAATLAHQFLLCVAVLTLALLLRLIDWRTLALGQRRLWIAGLTSLVFWSAFAIAVPDWHSATTTPARTLALLAYEFVGFPNVVRQVVVPWAHSLPLLGCVLALLIATEAIRTIRNEHAVPQSERVILIVLLALLMASSAASTPRYETRYIFYLYPLALIIAVSAASAGSRWLLAPGRRRDTATALACLGTFAVTEDFRPQHLLQIDSAAVAFRTGFSRNEAAQYPARADLSGAARWLQAHVNPRQDLVINAFPGVDFYYPRADFFFMDSSDERFESWSCRSGTVERWGNRPLLYSVQMLETRIATRPQVWLVIESGRRSSVLQRLTEADPGVRYRVVWVGLNPDISIVSLSRSKDPA